MSSVRETRQGKFELQVSSKLLPRRIYLTFDTEAQAKTYGAQLDQLLDAGVVPAEILERAQGRDRRRVNPQANTEVLRHMLGAWIDSGHPAPSDRETLELLIADVGQVKWADLNYAWAEAWVRSMKLDKNYAPGTIRKRVGSLSRAIDWWLRGHPDMQVANPLKLLPRGSATYNARDRADLAELAKAAPADAKRKVPRVDVERDRRLQPGEYERIEQALRGEKRPDRERPLQLPDGQAFPMLFQLILRTGVRMREATRVRRGHVDLAGKVLTVAGTKGWYGKIKWRRVPIRPELYPMLRDYLQALPDEGPQQLIFPYWDGDEATEDAVTNRLSQRFLSLYKYAACEGITEHDLRHEATCQWYELRDGAGQWVFREAEIHKIMGWSPGSKMPQRYTSFRGEDLASRMWSQADAGQ